MARKPSGKPKTPETFDGLKALIVDHYQDLRGQLKRIAEYTIENPNEIALKTVSAVADEIGVQPSSMVRFAKNFGYDGFSDLQQIFRSRLMAASPSYAERIQSFRQRRAGSEAADHPDQVLSDFVDQGMAALDLLRSQMPVGRIEKAVEVLANAKDIYVLAQRRSFPVAFYMSYALSRLDRRCILIDGVGGLLSQQASLATPEDAIVAISFRPYAPSVVEMVVERSADNVPVVAITDSALSPVALTASVAFEIQEHEDSGFRTLGAPMCLAQTLVVSLGHQLAAQSNGALEHGRAPN